MSDESDLEDLAFHREGELLREKILEQLGDRLFLRMSTSDERAFLLSCWNGSDFTADKQRVVKTIFQKYGV